MRPQADELGMYLLMASLVSRVVDVLGSSLKVARTLSRSKSERVIWTESKTSGTPTSFVRWSQTMASMTLSPRMRYSMPVTAELFAS